MPAAIRHGEPESTIDTAAVRRALNSFATDVTRRLARLRIRGLLRKRRLAVAFAAPAAGTLTISATTARRATVLAAGRRAYAAAGKAKVTIKLTPKGRKRLRKARRLSVSIKAGFTPTGAKAISTSRKVRLPR